MEIRESENREMKKIYFDMDGTIADLYAVEGWLAFLENHDVFPYANAKPMMNMQVLARQLNKLQAKGYEICVISWLSKSGNVEYNARVTTAKKKWLATHLASVHFNEIHIVEYGTPKNTLGQGILFDDEEHNRITWGEGAYEPKDIMAVLRGCAE